MTPPLAKKSPPSRNDTLLTYDSRFLDLNDIKTLVSNLNMETLNNTPPCQTSKEITHIRILLFGNSRKLLYDLRMFWTKTLHGCHILNLVYVFLLHKIPNWGNSYSHASGTESNQQHRSLSCKATFQLSDWVFGLRIFC